MKSSTATAVVLAMFVPACRALPKARLVDLGAREDLSAAPGFEIVAGWTKPYDKYFDAVGDDLYWTDGNDVFVGRDVEHSTALGVKPPPRRWSSDDRGIYWTTPTHELWSAGLESPARRLWAFTGEPQALTVGARALFLATGASEDHRELWRIEKISGAATRLWSGRIGRFAVFDDAVFFATDSGRVRRIDGINERGQTIDTGFDGLEGVDGTYVYGADRRGVHCVPTGNAPAITLTGFDRQVMPGIWTNVGASSNLAVEGNELFWVEGRTLYSASPPLGRRSALAAFAAGDLRVVPTARWVYVGDASSSMVYRVPRQAGARPSPVSKTGSSAGGIVASRGTAYWITGDSVEAWTGTGQAAPIVRRPFPASALAADGSRLYFTDDGGDLWTVEPKEGSSRKLVDVARLLPKVPVSHTIEVSPTFPRTVAVDGQNVYFISRSRGVIIAASADGAKASVIARGLLEPRALVAADRSLYFVADETTAVTRPFLFRLSKSGGPTARVDVLLSAPRAVASTLAAVYIADEGRTLVRIPKNTGEPELIALRGTAEIGAFASTRKTLFLSVADRILELEDGRTIPRVVVSGLPSPASTIHVDGRTLFYGDNRWIAGSIRGGVYALHLPDD